MLFFTYKSIKNKMEDLLMIKKEHIYAKADEKFVKTTVLYANSSKVLFYDKEAKLDKVKKDELKDLFLKGVVVFMTDVYYIPVCLKSTGLIANDGTATAVTFTAA